MQKFTAAAALRLLAILAATTLIAACADTSTAPRPLSYSARPTLDSTGFVGDSTLCRSGYNIMNGRIVCDP